MIVGAAVGGTAAVVGTAAFVKIHVMGTSFGGSKGAITTAA